MTSADSRNVVSPTVAARSTRAPALLVLEAEPQERLVVPGGVEAGPLPVDERHVGTSAKHVAHDEIAVGEPQSRVVSARRAGQRVGASGVEHAAPRGQREPVFGVQSSHPSPARRVVTTERACEVEHRVDVGRCEIARVLRTDRFAGKCREREAAGPCLGVEESGRRYRWCVPVQHAVDAQLVAEPPDRVVARGPRLRDVRPVGRPHQRRRVGLEPHAGILASRALWTTRTHVRYCRRPRRRGATPWTQLMDDAYAELHCHSNFSFLDGASHPEELAEEAVRLGLAALAITDHDGFYGVVRFAEAARVVGLPTVFGAELTLGAKQLPNGIPDPAGEHLIVLAQGPVGYARLAKAMSEAQLAGQKGAPRTSLAQLADAARAPVHLAGTTAARANDHWYVLTGCRKGSVPAALQRDGPAAARAALAGLVDAFGRDRVLVELWDHGDPIDRHRNDALAQLAIQTGVEVVATNNVHYATPSRRPLATALAAVRSGRSLDELDGWLPAGSFAHLRSPREQQRRFARWPGAVERTVEIANACRVRPEARRAAAARLSRTRRARRDVVAARAGAPRFGDRVSVVAQAARAGDAPDRLRAVGDRPARLPRLLPPAPRHRGVLPSQRHLLPGAGERGQQRGVLRARGHQGRRGRPRLAVRALLVTRARRPARHRPRHRAPAPRGGDPVRLRALRTRPRRAGRQRRHLPAPLRAAGDGQGGRRRTRPGRRAGQVGRPLGRRAGSLRRAGGCGRS